jgi:ABC-type branched-subunit amino acid transport system ATPase component
LADLQAFVVFTSQIYIIKTVASVTIFHSYDRYVGARLKAQKVRTHQPEISHTMLQIEIQSLKIGSRILGELMNIDVPVGEIHQLRGPNGSGKSLLLDVVTGIHRGTGVRVWISGRAIHNRTAYTRWQAGIRRMF